MKDEKSPYANADIGPRGPSPSYGESAQAGTVECESMRQKHWSELKEHERIERQREVTKRLEQRLEAAEAFIRALMEHKHDTGGSICGPMNPHRFMPKTAPVFYGDSAQRNPDDIYF